MKNKFSTSVMASLLLAGMLMIAAAGIRPSATAPVSGGSPSTEASAASAATPNQSAPVNATPSASVTEATTAGPERKLSLKEKIAVKMVQKKLKKAGITDTNSPKTKSQLVALLLCIFVGYLGIHRFYLGYTGIGILELFTAGVCGILTLIDLIRIITGDLGPMDGSYDETL